MPSAVPAEIGRVRRVARRAAHRPVFEETTGVDRPFRQHAPESEEVVFERRTGERLQGGALDVRLIEQRVLLLEIEHGGAHGRVVRAGAVLARVEQAFALEALFRFGEGRSFALEIEVLANLLGACDRRPRRRARSVGGASGSPRRFQALGRGRGACRAPSVPWKRPRCEFRRRPAACRRPRCPCNRGARRRETDGAAPTMWARHRKARDNCARPTPAADRHRRLGRPRDRGTRRGRDWRDRGRPVSIVAEIDEREPARPRRVRVDLSLAACISCPGDLNGPPLRRNFWPGGGQRVVVGAGRLLGSGRR